MNLKILGKNDLHKKQKYSEKILGGIRLCLTSFTGPIFVFTGPIFDHTGPFFDFTGPFLTEQAHFHALHAQICGFQAQFSVSTAQLLHRAKNIVQKRRAKKWACPHVGLAKNHKYRCGPEACA